ncbi:MAG TPA: peptidoglycan DD-metalloendopeptidase family protein [Sphingomicrobium sp.]|nr:peptidoglycan DD-metalloendopeptidase family protein [Sphingomicrobium sp.]
MRTLAIALLSVPLVSASAPAEPRRQSLGDALKAAQAEQASADAETGRLEKLAASGRNEAERLEAQEAAAAQAIEAAEARITAADAQLRLASAYVAWHRQQLAAQQQPISSLLAGLAVMARRPPLLALADGGGVNDLVKVSILIDNTLPVIRARTSAISADLAQGQRLEDAAHSARAELVRSRAELATRREQFAKLEHRALEQSLAASSSALGTSDVAIAAGEQVEQLRSAEASSQSALALAQKLASEGAAPTRPVPPAGSSPRPPFTYSLPVSAPVVAGLGAVNQSGVRSRGISFASSRGAAVRAPATGIVRFSGPFRGYDGIVILEHEGGWMSLITNVSSPLKEGDRVERGDQLGRALGRIDVELSCNGRRFSPALIAGSSESLSKGIKGG